MNQQILQIPAWYRAMTLSERITSRKVDLNSQLKLEINSQFASQLLHRWRSNCQFMNDEQFAQRLAIDRITEDDLIDLLSEPIQSVQEQLVTPPNWLINLAEAFSHPTALQPEPLPSLKELESQEIDLFLYAIEPLIRQGARRLHEGIKALSQTEADLPFDAETVAKVLFPNLQQKLLMILTPTLTLEVQVARLQERLKGDTPKERYYSFFEQLHQCEQVLVFLQEYPVLARQIITCIDCWVKFSLEFLQHLSADWKAIQTTFSPGKDPGKLVAVEGNAGDSHRGGRSVVIARFNTDFQLVYKPRNLSIDIHFQQLLAWLNERGDHPPFSTLKILNRDSYGWMEFVASKNCHSKEEIQRFYERQGGYLALLYALEATDFHHENLIAAGEHPVLIDLESLFHPRFGKIDYTQSDLLANEILHHSVLRIGLLPQRIWSKDKYKGIDISGLGAHENQILPDQSFVWERVGTDEMCLKREQMKLTAKSHRPTIKGTEVNILDYAEAISTGFTKVYQLLLKHRNSLLSKEGPLARFAMDPARVILRPTRFYALLLKEGFHPDLLRDALRRDQFFERLWIGIEPQSNMTKVIRAERVDLWQGDVPMFLTQPNSCDLLTSSQERIPDFFDASGMTLVERRLQKLSNADLAQQIRLLNTSLASLEQAYWPSYCLPEPQSEINSKQLLMAARSVGDRLEELAIRGKEDITWIGLIQANTSSWTTSSLGVDFYDGIPGITLFLATLGIITQEKRYTSLAQAALITLKRQIEPNKLSFKSIGGFGGWGGIIYTLTHLSKLWEQPELLALAEEFVMLLPPLIQQDENLDISSGAAGCIGSLLSLYRCHPSKLTLATAIQCGDHLIAQAQIMPHGIGWLTTISKTQPLTGFAHGAAGIAWALLDLYALTSEERFRKAALDAITYERSLFCPEVGNWPDLRNFADAVLLETNINLDSCMTAWCYGAPGIGLARLHSLPYLDDPKIRSEINIALKTTLAHGFGRNHSLCHGDLGNLELLLQASQILDDPQWKTQVNHFAAIILESIDKHGWICGVPLGVETPGLMTGLAGIGYGLLRLAAPEFVPSVLVLEPPKFNSNIENQQIVTDRAAIKIA